MGWVQKYGRVSKVTNIISHWYSKYWPIVFNITCPASEAVTPQGSFDTLPNTNNISDGRSSSLVRNRRHNSFLIFSAVFSITGKGSLIFLIIFKNYTLTDFQICFKHRSCILWSVGAIDALIGSCNFFHKFLQYKVNKGYQTNDHATFNLRIFKRSCINNLRQKFQCLVKKNKCLFNFLSFFEFSARISEPKTAVSKLNLGRN